MFRRRRPKPNVYSDHAKEQMERRRITKTDVETALASVDTTYPGSDKNRQNLVKEGLAPDGRRLVVVVKERSQHVIVSAYWR